MFKNISRLPKLFRSLSHHVHDSHHPPKPYDVKHPEPYPTEAYMFGRKPGSPLEGWEVITIGTFVAAFLIMVVGHNTKTEESFQVLHFISAFCFMFTQLFIASCGLRMNI